MIVNIVFFMTNITVILVCGLVWSDRRFLKGEVKRLKRNLNKLDIVVSEFMVKKGG